MGANINTGLLLYGAGSLLGALSYTIIIVIQQFTGSSLSRIFFSFDEKELMVISSYSGLSALVFMFIQHEKYKNILFSLLPSLIYISVTKGGYQHILKSFNTSNLFANYEIPLAVATFAIVWGMGIAKLARQ